jgi:hypothetical protein
MVASPSNQSPNKPSVKSELLLLLLLYTSIRLAWIFMIPMEKAPDEFAHYWVIKFMGEHLSLPNSDEVLADGASSVYGSLPQFGYLPHVLTGFLQKLPCLGFIDYTRFIRLGSLLAGAPVIVSAFILGKKLFPVKCIQLALPLCLVLHPQFVFVTSYANNDATTAGIAGCLMLVLYRLMEKGFLLRLNLYLGCLLGFLALSKLSGWCLMPALTLGYFLAAWLNKTTGLTLLRHGLLVIGLSGSLSVWWFLRNSCIYPGDYLGTKTMVRSWAAIYHKDPDATLSLSRVLKEKTWWEYSFNSFWGLFGYLDLPLPSGFYQTFLLFVVAAAGSISWRITQTKVFLTTLLKRDQKASTVNCAYWLFLFCCLALNFCAMVFAQMQNLGGGQGRYLFPSEIPIFALLLLGLKTLPGKLSTWATSGFIGLLALALATASLKLYTLFGLALDQTF